MNMFFDRAPQYPTDLRVQIFKEVRRVANQALLQDPRPSKCHEKNKLWKKMTDDINKVCNYFVY